jgi:pyruvate dehydrogenase E2 component (dihydrolipoamide acetyltransferase)
MDVLMPQLGETVTEGKITVWFKSVGDAVRPGENLFEIETDKTSMEVPATTAGTLAEIRVRQGEVAPVSAVVAVIADGGVAAAVVKSPVRLEAFREVHTPDRRYGPAKLPNGVVVSPLARRMAVEAGVDLTSLKGSGPHGRIHAHDVKAAIAAGPAPAPVQTPIQAPGSDAIRALYKGSPFEEVALDAMRRTIARRLMEAKQTIPHFYLSTDVDLDRLLGLREGASLASGTKLSINDFAIKAFALALKSVPLANAIWAADSILRFQQVDIGVAVAIEGGLLTPIIRKAETKPLAAISAEMKGLAVRARERKLQPSDYQGGVASISNLGMHSVREFSAIINPPQSSILAIGAALRRPAEGPDGALRFVTQMTVTLSCDHRVVDGVLGAQLLAAFKGAVENPECLFA